MSKVRELWTKDAIIKEALKYKTKGEWERGNRKSYQAAVHNKIMDEACEHMNTRLKFWTKQSILTEALNYKTKQDWKIGSRNGYSAAIRLKILDEACQHMVDGNIIWTKESVLSDAVKYKTRFEWMNSSPRGYGTARRMGILDEACKHAPRIGGTSGPEKSIFEIVAQNYPKTQMGVFFTNKKPAFVAKRFQLDIYIPELRKGIEFDGTYWHSMAGLKRSRPKWSDEDLKNCHDIKDLFFKERDIDVLHVKEEDWKKNPKICLSKIFEFLKIECLVNNNTTRRNNEPT
jgi:hypothetical protein